MFDDGSLVTSGAHMVHVVIAVNFYQAAGLESQLFNYVSELLSRPHIFSTCCGLLVDITGDLN